MCDCCVLRDCMTDARGGGGCMVASSSTDCMVTGQRPGSFPQGQVCLTVCLPTLCATLPHKAWHVAACMCIVIL